MMIIDIETLIKDDPEKDERFSCVDLDFQKDLGMLFPYYWNEPPKSAYLVNALDFSENIGFCYVVARDLNGTYKRSEIVTYPLLDRVMYGIEIQAQSIAFYHFQTLNNGEPFLITKGFQFDNLLKDGNRVLNRNQALNLVNLKG